MKALWDPAVPVEDEAVWGVWDDNAEDEEAAEAELAEEQVLHFEAPVAEGGKKRAVAWLGFRLVYGSKPPS
eukprot:2898212-Amphidinium_carterae.1